MSQSYIKKLTQLTEMMLQDATRTDKERMELLQEAHILDSDGNLDPFFTKVERQNGHACPV